MICKQSKHRILIVDDNVDAGELFRIILEMQGYEVSLSFDGMSALCTTRTFRPHVIFTNIVMPGMSGFELAAALRKDEYGSGALIVAISGYAGEYAHSQNSTAQFDRFLTKPVAYADICAMLTSYFDDQAILPVV